MPSSSAEAPVKEFRTRAAWAKWLERHHGDDAGVWVKFAKKGTGVTTVTYAEALEVALCYGWIDAQVKRFDETYYLQRFTPRRARSKWSKINHVSAERLDVCSRWCTSTTPCGGGPYPPGGCGGWLEVISRFSSVGTDLRSAWCRPRSPGATEARPSAAGR